ncbi:MAG: HmuY family protein [Dysgonamonadaceae bacterium]|jgi:hypothetical protein|nr:HmuY family protein [Dysgonamonadaceae bacterium]
MNIQKTFQLFVLILLSGVGFFSCDNKDDLFQKSEPKEGLVILDCSSYTQWNFFSFAKGEIIGTCDAGNETDNETWRKRTDWDLAFHRQDVKTNSGESGTGKGGILAYDFNGKDFHFDLVTVAPGTGYAVDEPDSIIYDMSQMMQGKIGYIHTGLAQPTKKWAVLEDMMNSKWVYAQKVFVVRTADSKYAKIYLKNFKSDAGASGTVTMQYVYQPDKTTHLDVKQEED